MSRGKGQIGPTDYQMTGNGRPVSVKAVMVLTSYSSLQFDYKLSPINQILWPGT